jgi:DNA-binding protein Fis
LTVEGLKDATSVSNDENITSIREQLKWTVVEAIANWQADVNIQDTCNQYGIHEQEIPILMTQAGFTARDRGNNTLALELFKTAMDCLILMMFLMGGEDRLHYFMPPQAAPIWLQHYSKTFLHLQFRWETMN